MAEISVTGGRAVTSAVVRALGIIPGLRPAEPGEFAWRAFMNGKIDLSEVEGLADLVEAETEAQRQQAQRIAGGALSRECEAIRRSLLEAMAAVETQIDFTDVEDASDFTLETVSGAARAALERIDRALATADSAQRLRDGFTVVIAGPPNVGKSTLMNALAGRDVAIISPIPGTTRDLIEVFLDLRGYPVILVDTAGIRESHDPIEQEGRRESPSQSRECGPDALAERQRGQPGADERNLPHCRCGPRSTSRRRTRGRKTRQNSPYRREQGRGSTDCLTPLPIWPKSACLRVSRLC